MVPNRKRKSKRRSSILKGASPKDILCEVDNNVDKTTNVRKSRRVSFASTYMVKEFLKDSPKVPVVNNSDVPSMPAPPINSTGTHPEPAVDNGNITQWGNVSMDMTETVPVGALAGNVSSADPSPISKLDSQSLLQRMSGLKSNYQPRSLCESGVQLQPNSSGVDLIPSTGGGFGMELTQCIDQNQDTSTFPESRSAKSFMEKTVYFQGDNTCDMSVTMLQPPLNFSTLNPNQPPAQSPGFVTKSLLSKLGAFKKSTSNPVLERTKLHNSGDDSAIMDFTCLPGNITMSSTESYKPIIAQTPSVPPAPCELNLQHKVSNDKENASDPTIHANTALPGYPASEMDITCTREAPEDMTKRRVSFAPIISHAFVLNDSTSTVASEPGHLDTSYAERVAGVGLHSLIPGNVSNIIGAGNTNSLQERGETSSSAEQTGLSANKGIFVTSDLLSKLSAGTNRPQNVIQTNALLSKLIGGASKTTTFPYHNTDSSVALSAKQTDLPDKTTVFTSENDMEMTGVLTAKATSLSNNVTAFPSENDMEMTGVLFSKPTGFPDKTTVFSSGNDMDMTSVISAKPTGVSNKTTIFSSENDMDETGVLTAKATGVPNKTTVFSEENNMEMTQFGNTTGVLLSKPTALSNITTACTSENDMDMSGVLSAKPTGLTKKTTVYTSENDMATGLPDKQTVLSSQNDMIMTHHCNTTGVLSSISPSSTDKTAIFTSENDMEETAVLSSKPTGLPNKTTVFSSENDMDMTGVLVAKATGFSNKTTVFSSENDMEMTRFGDTTGVLLPKPTGLPNRTTVFTFENDMDETGVLIVETTGLPNRTTVFPSENMEMTRLNNTTGVVSSKLTGVPNKPTVLSSKDDMEMSGVLASKATGLPNKTTLFSSENDMEMTHFNNTMGVLLSKPTGLPDTEKTTVFSSENDMEMTGVLSVKPTGLPNKTTVFSSDNYMDMTCAGNSTGVLSSKPTDVPNRTTVFASENDMDMTGVLYAKQTGLPNRTTVFSSENDMEMTHAGNATDVLLSKQTDFSNKTTGSEMAESRIDNCHLAKQKKDDHSVNMTVSGADDTDDDEVSFRLPACSDEPDMAPLGHSEYKGIVCTDSSSNKSISLTDSAEILRGAEGSISQKEPSDSEEQLHSNARAVNSCQTTRDKIGLCGNVTSNSVFGSQFELTTAVDRSLAAETGSDCTTMDDKKDDENEENIEDESLELVDITGDQQSALLKDQSAMHDDIKSSYISSKHTNGGSVSHISDLADASSIMPKMTHSHAFSFSAIDDMSMTNDISNFDDFLAIFRIILYDPVGRGNSLCPPQDNGDSLAEKLKVIYCMEPELELIEEGNRHLTALLAGHEEVFRALEAEALPGLIAAVKDERKKKEMQEFIQKIQKICSEQAYCDVKQLRLVMLQELNKTLTDKHNKFESDVKLLQSVPEKLKLYREDVETLDQAMECLRSLREVKSQGDGFDEQIARSAERQDELRAQIEAAKAELQQVASPGSSTRQLKNKLFRLRESVSWSVNKSDSRGAIFAWLGNLIRLDLTFGDMMEESPGDRTVISKSFLCSVGTDAKSADSFAANLMMKSSILEKITCETTKQIPQLLDAVSEMAYCIEVLQKDLAAIEWFHDIKTDDLCGLVFCMSEYKTVSKVKISLKFDPDHLDQQPLVCVEPLFGNIRGEELLSQIESMQCGPGFLKRLTETVQKYLLQCPSLMTSPIELHNVHTSTQVEIRSNIVNLLSK